MHGWAAASPPRLALVLLVLASAALPPLQAQASPSTLQGSKAYIVPVNLTAVEETPEFRELLSLYNKTVELSREGVNTTPAVVVLREALHCIAVGNTSCARKALTEAKSVLEQLEEEKPGLIERNSRYIAAGLILTTPLLVYLALPRAYLRLWLRLHRHWVLEGEGRTLGEAAQSARSHRELLSLYQKLRRGELRLRDPRPPRDFLEYLTRPDYTLWFWAATATGATAAALALTSPPALHPLQVVAGSLFVLFLPGYATVEALYPEEESLKPLEHLALSIGLSLAITPLIGLALNYTPWGIRLPSVTASLLAYTQATLLIAAYRKHRAARGPETPTTLTQTPIHRG